MNPNLRTLECLERVLQKTIPRNTAPFLRKVDLKIGDHFNKNVVHKVGQCGPCDLSVLSRTSRLVEQRVFSLPVTLVV